MSPPFCWCDPGQGDDDAHDADEDADDGDDDGFAAAHVLRSYQGRVNPALFSLVRVFAL